MSYPATQASREIASACRSGALRPALRAFSLALLRFMACHRWVPRREPFDHVMCEWPIYGEDSVKMLSIVEFPKGKVHDQLGSIGNDCYLRSAM